MTSTISQCQMLKLPMDDSCDVQTGIACCESPVGDASLLPVHARTKRLRAPKHVDVEMIHLLPPYPAVVDHHPETVSRALLSGQLPDHTQHSPEQL